MEWKETVSEVTGLINGRAGAWTQAVCLQNQGPQACPVRWSWQTARGEASFPSCGTSGWKSSATCLLHSLPVTSARRAPQRSWAIPAGRPSALNSSPSREPPAAALMLTTRPTHGLCSLLSSPASGWLGRSCSFQESLTVNCLQAPLPPAPSSSGGAPLPCQPSFLHSLCGPCRRHLGSPPPTSCLWLEPLRSAVYWS